MTATVSAANTSALAVAMAAGLNTQSAANVVNRGVVELAILAELRVATELLSRILGSAEALESMRADAQSDVAANVG